MGHPPPPPTVQTRVLSRALEPTWPQAGRWTWPEDAGQGPRDVSGSPRHSGQISEDKAGDGGRGVCNGEERTVDAEGQK